MKLLKNWDNKTWLSSKEYINLFNSFLLHKKKLNKNSKILEIASNDGTFLRDFKKKNHFVIGVDPAKNIAQIANNANIKTIPKFFNLNTSKNIKKNYGKFDFVFAMESIYYSDSMEKAIKKIYKLLKPGGQFFCGTDFYTENKDTVKWANMMKIQMHLHSKKEWKEFFKNAGFSVQTKQIKDLKGNEKWKREMGTLFIIGTNPLK